jgi:hypothetical protein
MPRLRGDLHQCPMCPKRYTRYFNLQSHFLTHENLRPFACTVCERRFFRQDDRKSHERLHLPNARSFVCRGVLTSGQEWGCGRRFSRKQNLERHFKSEKGMRCKRPLADEQTMTERQAALVAARALTGMGNASSSAPEHDHQPEQHSEQAPEECDPLGLVKSPCVPSRGDGDAPSFEESLLQAPVTAPPTRDDALSAADTIRQYIRHHGQLNYQLDGIHGHLELNFKPLTVQAPLLDLAYFAGMVASQNPGGEHLLYPDRSLDNVSWY